MDKPLKSVAQAQRQTYGYLPSRRASPPLDHYQIILAQGFVTWKQNGPRPLSRKSNALTNNQQLAYNGLPLTISLPTFPFRAWVYRQTDKLTDAAENTPSLLLSSDADPQQISIESCCCCATYGPRNFGPTAGRSNIHVVSMSDHCYAQSRIQLLHLYGIRNFAYADTLAIMSAIKLVWCCGNDAVAVLIKYTTSQCSNQTCGASV